MATLAAGPAATTVPPNSRRAIDPIRAEAIRTLYAQMRYTNFATLVITLYMTGVSWAFTSHGVILGWAALVIVLAAVRELVVIAFRRRAPPDAELERWALYY